MEKVLFISYNGMTDPLGQSQVLPYLSNLSKQGYSITILSCEKKDKMERDGAFIGDLISTANMKWHPLTFHDSVPILSKIYDRYLLKKVVFKLYRKERFNWVHCRSYIAAEIGFALKRTFGAKFIFDMRGFWADEKKDSNHWNVDKPIYKRIYSYYKKLERKLLINADFVVVLTHAAKDEIIKWNIRSVVADKIEVIPCCADLSLFSDEKINLSLQSALKEEMGLVDAYPVVCYLGSIGDTYATNEMLYFFSQLKKIYPAAKFLFFTKDAPLAVTDRIKNYSNLAPSDIIVRFVQRAELPTYLSLCTFSLFFYVPTYSRIACSPTKFAEISGLGLPVVCNVVGDLNRQYLQGLPHVVINDLSNASIEESVTFVETFQHVDKNTIRNFATENYNLMDGVAKYLSIYKKLSV